MHVEQLFAQLCPPMLTHSVRKVCTQNSSPVRIFVPWGSIQGSRTSLNCFHYSKSASLRMRKLTKSQCLHRIFCPESQGVRWQKECMHPEEIYKGRERKTSWRSRLVFKWLNEGCSMAPLDLEVFNSSKRVRGGYSSLGAEGCWVCHF